MDVASNVATIVQLIDFSISVLSRIKDYVDSGIDAPNVYRNIAHQLPLHIEDLSRLKQLQSNIPDVSGGMMKAIIGYNAELVALDKLLDTLLPAAAASKPRRILAAVYSFAKDKQIKSMWKTVREYRATLIPYIGAALKPSSSIEVTLSLFDIPLIHAPNFVPRPLLMDRILKLLEHGGSNPGNTLSTTVVLLGMGGQGKTQIALDICRNAKRDGAVKAVFWIDASSRNAAMNSIKGVAKRLFPSRHFDDKSAPVPTTYVMDKLVVWKLVCNGAFTNNSRNHNVEHLREDLVC